MFKFRKSSLKLFSSDSRIYLCGLLLLFFLSAGIFPFVRAFPLALLFGPFLFGFVKKLNFKVFFLHCLPFISYHLLSVLLPEGLQNFGIADSSLIAAVSLATYGILGLLDKKTIAQQPIKQVLKDRLSLLFLIISIFFVLIGLENSDEIQVGFTPEYLVLIILFFCGSIVYQHLLMEEKFMLATIETAEGELPEEEETPVETTYLQEHLEKLQKYPLKEEIFLNSNLTLEKLSQDLDIQKHHLSQCFTLGLNTSFYEYVANFRIRYAMEQIKAGNALTLESLAYECGFNSKTSFTKYFKEYTGMLPSEFRKKIKAEKVAEAHA